MMAAKKIESCHEKTKNELFLGKEWFFK